MVVGTARVRMWTTRAGALAADPRYSCRARPHRGLPCAAHQPMDGALKRQRDLPVPFLRSGDARTSAGHLARWYEVTLSTSFFDPSTTLTRSCSFFGWMSRMRSRPLVDAPPACSTSQLIGLASYI